MWWWQKNPKVEEQDIAPLPLKEKIIKRKRRKEK
jgi:hypothetical protein